MLKKLGMSWNHAMVAEDIFEKAQLRGKVCIVTGTTFGGIGWETAKKLYNLGATVIMTVRNDKIGKEAIDEMKEASKDENGNGHVEYMLMDLSDLSSVQSMATQFKKSYQQLDYLINNAGVMICPHSTTKQGIEVQFGTNHLGHFLLTNLVLDLLKQSQGRIINVSSSAARLAIGKNDLKSTCSYTEKSVMGSCEDVASKNHLYGRSKLANILFTKKLMRELESSGVVSYSLHPGAIKTNLQRHVNGALLIFGAALSLLFKNPYQGAQTTLFVALSSRNELKNGGFYEECKLEEGSPFEDDVALQDKLWETSLKLVAPYEN